MDVFQSAWYRLVLLFFAMYLTVLWFVLGPSNPWYAVSVVAGTFSLGPAVASAPMMRRVPRQWLHVPAGERVFHRIVGADIFSWLLDISRWNRHVAESMRGFSGKRAGLPALEQSVRSNANAHVSGANFSRLDSLEKLKGVPAGFAGFYLNRSHPSHRFSAASPASQAHSL